MYDTEIQEALLRGGYPEANKVAQSCMGDLQPFESSEEAYKKSFQPQSKGFLPGETGGGSPTEEASENPEKESDEAWLLASHNQPIHTGND